MEGERKKPSIKDQILEFAENNPGFFFYELMRHLNERNKEKKKDPDWGLTVLKTFKSLVGKEIKQRDCPRINGGIESKYWRSPA